MAVLILAGAVFLTSLCLNGGKANAPMQQDYILPNAGKINKPQNAVNPIAVAIAPKALMDYPTMALDAKTFSDTDIDSKQAVLIDVANNKIIAQRDCDARIYPASLTKIMTLIVAVEEIESLDDTFVMTEEIVTAMVNEGASRAGFLPGEEIRLIDLLYGAILPSGADATIGIAEKLCGTEAEFVQLMNNKVKQLGLLHTNFVNSSGLHDDNHYTTPVDMAMILQYATENELCRKILSTYEYTSAPTEQNPTGLKMTSTMFSRMYGDEAPGVLVEGGKMGFTDEAGNCLASFANKNGNTYIAVTTSGAGKYMPIYDAIKIYTNFLP